MKLFLCGDVMTGRGIDQILPAPCDPALDEPWVKSALDYVRLAEQASGPIPRAADPACIWGDALEALEREQPSARIINLETAVTLSEQRAPKGINYRMSPANAACLSAARIDCCVLANNHVLDWGRAGLEETLEVLHRMGIRTAGAGREAGEAQAPAALPAGATGRLLVFAFGMESSGVPEHWAATSTRAGVSWLPELSSQTTEAVADRMLAARRTGDLVVASIHWGSNWGYDVAGQKRSFAHRLIDAGAADLVHGHSSHHPRPIEVYKQHAILYGCGDFLNDYEGIPGHDAFRPELALMYFPVLDEVTGRLQALTLTPMRIHKFHMKRATPEEAEWLGATLSRESLRFGTRIERMPDGRLLVR